MSDIVWEIASYHDEKVVDELSKQLNISKTFVKLLLNRGLTNKHQINKFLTPDISHLHDPLQMLDMVKAVERINAALKNGEKILIYGDYDADGITATSIVFRALKKLGSKVDYYVPNRDEGYGLNTVAIEAACRQRVSLIITVDCGISARHEVDYAKRLGIDVIVTDHHEPPKILPDAVAVINPKQQRCNYPYKDLAGVGVAFKLVQALFGHHGIAEQAFDFTDLVALGTVADVVPLTGENRVLVKVGLDHINRDTRPGIRAILNSAGFDNEKPVSSEHLGFIVAPRLNAMGRISSARPGVELLTADDPSEAEQLAAEVELYNKERQMIEAEIVKQARQTINDTGLYNDKVIVAAADGWHPGVIGIAASRIAEEFYRPTVLITTYQTTGRGSARSIPGFNIFKAVERCAQVLERFGGHEMAAGLEINPQNIKRFRKLINDAAPEIAPKKVWQPKIVVEAYLPVKDITTGLVAEIQRLEPFGTGNPEPVFATSSLRISDYRWVGKSADHLKVKFCAGGRLLDGIGFRFDKELNIQTGARADVVYTLSINRWNGFENVQMNLKQLNIVSKEELEFKKILRLIYSCLRQVSGNRRWLKIKPDDLAVHIRKSFGVALEPGVIDLGLNIFEEVKLIEKKKECAQDIICFKQDKKQKTDLRKSESYKLFLRRKYKRDQGEVKNGFKI